jgi:uncharacterized protein (TIGR03790 family)
VANFPDRPAGSGIGLRAVLAAGDDGQYLSHNLLSAHAILHVRLAFHPATVAGGLLVLLRGLNSSDGETMRLTYETTTRQITFALPTGTNISATLLTELSWHVVEIKLDTANGDAQLWINGLSAGQTSGSFAALTTQTVWLGVIYKATAATGELYLDEWVMAEEYVGPVRIEPAGDYANDPTRWLVIYNTSNADSRAWVDTYRAARNIPYANLLGLSLSSSETIDAAAYADLVNATNDYLTTNALTDQVMGLLLGYGVPGYVDFDDNGTLDAVAALMHRNLTVAGYSFNNNAADALPTRPTYSSLSGDRLTARMDGANLTNTLALIDRATALKAEGLNQGDSATIWFDCFPGPGALFQPAAQQMLGWALSLDRKRTRLPLQLAGDPASTEAAEFAQVDNDGFFWGWSSTTPPPELFGAPAGDRIFSLQIHTDDPTATTLRSATPSNWIDRALADGYASAAASSRAYSISAAPLARPFFEALRLGWTLAEAWYLALPVLREGLYLVGDPLLTVAMPKTGWDVFGPFERLEDLDATQPSDMLRSAQTSLALPTSLQPSEGLAGRYIVRNVDEAGRSEASVVGVGVVNLNGVAAREALRPVWPQETDWPVWVEQGQAVVRLLWDRPMSSCRLAQVELRAQPVGGAESTVFQAKIDVRARSIETAQPLGSTALRYRWRITSADGVIWHTPWSTTLFPAEPATVALTLMEIRP